MKYNHFKLKLRSFVAVLALFVFGVAANAQHTTVSGVVKDAKTGEPILGASILEKGTNKGIISDLEGAFTISTSSNATLVVKYIGYRTVEVPVAGKTSLTILLNEDVVALGEVVAIGYGSVKKNDATGSVVAISAEKMPKGLATSMTDMIGGKIAGVNVTTSGGAPGAGATIRIRGGSSLNASNDPLIIIDNVPLSSETISGVANPLSSINPQDIETFTVLKDASATAIYGSRASNGVIIITTKKGSLKQKFSVSYDGSASVSSISKQINVLSADEYKTFVKSYYGTTSTQAALLGNSSTDWQKQIYQTAIGQDHNISVSGATGILPYRVSVGYTNQDGVLKTSNYSRTTASINLTPSLFEDHLKINANAKGAYITNRFADTGAIGAALEYDPTQSVNSANSTYGNGYTMWLGSDGKPLSLGTANPVSVLTQKKDVSTVYQSTGGVLFDYKLHWLPDLHANLNLSYDVSKSNGSVTIAANSPISYVWGNDKSGSAQYSPYYQFKSNALLDFYLNYNKTFGIHKIDAMTGYSWQHFYKTSWSSSTFDTNHQNDIARKDYPSEYYLVSFYGRLNYTLLDKYLATFTLRDDGTSRFGPSNRWGLFPSAALAWKLKEESFLQDVKWLSDLKLRLGYGLTGQQSVSDSYYPYISTYTTSTATDAMYQFGGNYYNLLRPDAYNSTLKWETTTTYNLGIDFGLFNNRITGSVDVYKRITNDLLNYVTIAAGTNFTNKLLSNIGSLENKGIEFSLSGRAIETKDFTWDLSYNVSHNENKVTKLNRGGSSTGVTGTSISGGTGNTICITQVGYPINSYYVYKQVYDASGKPIEGSYANNNSLYISSHSAAPDVTMGLSSRMNYKNWFLNFALRASIGNYNYNNVQSRLESKSNTYDSSGFLKNIVSSGLTTNFSTAQYLSDYYIQNASFVRMDNISLGYTFNNFLNNHLKASLYGTVQNPFVITKYKGLDPEVDGGIDNNVYPRPQIYILGLRFNF